MLVVQHLKAEQLIEIPDFYCSADYQTNAVRAHSTTLTLSQNPIPVGLSLPMGDRSLN